MSLFYYNTSFILIPALKGGEIIILNDSERKKYDIIKLFAESQLSRKEVTQLLNISLKQVERKITVGEGI